MHIIPTQFCTEPDEIDYNGDMSQLSTPAMQKLVEAVGGGIAVTASRWAVMDRLTGDTLQLFWHREYAIYYRSLLPDDVRLKLSIVEVE